MRRIKTRLLLFTASIVIIAAAAIASIPRPASVAFAYGGTAIPAQDRAALEESLKHSIHPAHATRMIVTISDRQVATR